MNKDNYCSYELSAALKEAGFCEMTYGKYVDCPNDPTLFHGMQYEPWNLSKDEICAPLLSQAHKWLREDKGVYIDIWICACGYGWEICKCSNPNNTGTSILRFDEESGDDDASGMFTTYEKALSDAIEKAIDLI